MKSESTPVDEEKPYTCNICDDRFSQPQHLNHHMQDSHGKAQQRRICKFCHEYFSRPNKLQLHEATCQGPENQPQSEEPQTDDEVQPEDAMSTCSMESEQDDSSSIKSLQSSSSVVHLQGQESLDTGYQDYASSDVSLHSVASTATEETLMGDLDVSIQSVASTATEETFRSGLDVSIQSVTSLATEETSNSKDNEGAEEKQEEEVRCNICPGMRMFETMEELENHIEVDHATMSLQDFVFAHDSRSLSANM